MNVKTKRYSPLTAMALRVFYFTFSALWLTGALWAIVQFTKSAPSDLRTPSQTTLMQIHGAIAMIALICLGSFVVHIKEGLAIKTNVLSGLSIVVVMGVLILTTWFLYYVADETVRYFASWIHLLLGLSLPLFLVGHGALGKKLRKSRRL